MNDSIKSILEDYTEDEYEELCRRADCLGMCSLTEEEQIVVMYWSQREEDNG